MERFRRGATLMPGLSDEEIGRLQRRISAPIPEPIRELLRYAAGFQLPSVGSVQFTGAGTVDLPGALPASLALLADGSGNFWVVDIDPANGAWGPVFFVCHDPPVLAMQAPELGAFLFQILAPAESTPGNALAYVQDECVARIWKHDPWLTPAREAGASHDPALFRFAQQVPDTFRIADLRSREVGSGFSWGSAGADAEVRRAGNDLIFAAEQRRPGFLRKILSRSR